MPLWPWTIDGTITEFNKGAEKLFGWKKEEVVQKENIAITLPSDAQRWR